MAATDVIQALSYASIILSDGEKEINEENLKKVLDFCGIVCDPWTLTAFANAAGKIPVSKMCNDFGSCSAAGPAPAAGAPADGAPAAVEAAPEEPEEEESSVAAGGMFGNGSGSDSDDDSS